MKGNVLSGESCIFVTSDRKMTVYGCEGVEKYTENEIVLKLVGITLTVSGNSLGLSSYFGSEIGVTGAIERLEMSRDRKGKEKL